MYRVRYRYECGFPVWYDDFGSGFGQYWLSHRALPPTLDAALEFNSIRREGRNRSASAAKQSHNRFPFVEPHERDSLLVISHGFPPFYRRPELKIPFCQANSAIQDSDKTKERKKLVK